MFSVDGVWDSTKGARGFPAEIGIRKSGNRVKDGINCRAKRCNISLYCTVSERISGERDNI